jgi:ABC-type lipoprotein export system ATPase subunit
LADLPTANLDAQASIQVLKRFRNLAKNDGRAHFFVTRDPRMRSVADRVFGIEDGAILK